MFDYMETERLEFQLHVSSVMASAGGVTPKQPIMSEIEVKEGNRRAIM
jgi:hypothetical protein